MQHALSLRKLTHPHLPTILHRHTLIEALQEVIAPASSYKLVLLCAPDGYGKTTLLADFTQHTSITCCWCFLDSSDSNIHHFLNMLLGSIHQAFPHFGTTFDTQLKALAHTEPTQWEHHDLLRLVDTLVTSIQTEITTRFALFLCDYHEINDNDTIRIFMNLLLASLPQNCILGIESRAIPTFELASLLTQHQLFGLGSDRLRFNTQEIGELARLYQLEINDEEAQQLVTSFDGWITGILLGTRLGNGLLSSSSLQEATNWGAPALRMSRQNLFSYLTNKIFKHEPEVYSFLKEASILQQMEPELCNALLGIHNSKQLLAYIEKQGIFVTRGHDETQNSYFCLPALRELLYEEFLRQDSVRAIALHRKATEIFYTRKEYEKAITHAFAAHATDLAASIILEIAKPLLHKGQSEIVAHWIDLLPPDTAERYPQLLLWHATICLSQNQNSKATHLINTAHTIITQKHSLLDPDVSTIMLAELYIAQSQIAFETCEYRQTQQLCRQALALLPANERELRASAYQRMGMSASLLGDCINGISQMQQALQLWGHNTEILQTALLHGHLANAYHFIGNYALAEHHRARAIASCDRLGNIRGKINNMIGMALTKRNKGALDKAEQLLCQALEMAQEFHFQRGVAYALVNLGEIYLDQKQLGKALTAIEDGLALGRLLEDILLTNMALDSLALTYLLMGDAQTAHFLIEQVEIREQFSSNSYENLLVDLTRGTIYLYQQNYHEAYRCFLAIQEHLQQSELKLVQMRFLIRLAMCQLALGKESDALQLVQQAQQLAKAGEHEHVVQTEMERFPQLQQALEQNRSSDQKKDAIDAPTVIDQTPKTNNHIILQEPADTPIFRVLAFGEPTIIINDTPITRWRMARSLELYFFLLDYGRPARKDHILTALWSDDDEHMDQTLRSTIYYLRKAIGEACIIYSGGCYTLNSNALDGNSIWYDVATYRQCAAEAKLSLTAEDDVAAEQTLQRMIDLYRGDYVQSFYSDWCIMRRDELRRMYMDGRKQLAQLVGRQERLDESIMHWQHLLAVDNCQEDAHYGLIRCYMRQGKRALALRQYQHCVEILHEELSIAPGPGIQKLYQRLTGNG